jgi:hypothetical protein
LANHHFQQHTTTPGVNFLLNIQQKREGWRFEPMSLIVRTSLLARHRLELIGEGLAGQKLCDILHCGLADVG